MSDDTGLITVHVPINGGKRATRIKLPGDCTLVEAKYGGLITKKYANTAVRGKPVIAMTFRLVERYDEPIERCFRIATPHVIADWGLEAGKGRCMGTIAQVNDENGELAWEVIEMRTYDVGTRISDIQTMPLVRGMNRLVFKDKIVVRVNGVAVGKKQLPLRSDGLFGPEGIMIGGQRRKSVSRGVPQLQWELRYQSRRKHGGMIGWVFIGTDEDADCGRVPAALREGSKLNRDLRVWLSVNLCV